MPAYEHLEVTEVGDWPSASRNCRMTEDADIQEFGNEMFSLVENDKREVALEFFDGRIFRQRGPRQADHTFPEGEVSAVAY